MNQHTKGPWAVDSELPPNTRSVVAKVIDELGDVNIYISGNTNGPHDLSEGPANTRLIAAAPELLEAVVVMTMAWDHPTVKSVRMRGDAIQSLRTAIAKATSG